MKKIIGKGMKLLFVIMLMMSIITLSPIIASSSSNTTVIDLSNGDIIVQFGINGQKTYIEHGAHQREDIRNEDKIVIIQSDQSKPTEHSITLNVNDPNIFDGENLPQVKDKLNVVIRDLNMNKGSIIVNGDATINLEGINNIKSNNTAVQIGPKGTTTLIQGSGSLNATSYNGAGIGTLNHGTGGDLVISHTAVFAKGGSNAAGIGCGAYATMGNITMNQASVFATGGDNGAGIGTGISTMAAISKIGNIAIHDCGIVDVSGGLRSAAIGTGYGVDVSSILGTIDIMNSKVSAAAGMSDAIIQASTTALDDASVYEQDSPNAIGNGTNNTLSANVTIDALSHIIAMAPGDHGKAAIATSSITNQFANNILQGTYYTENRNNPLVSKNAKAVLGIYGKDGNGNDLKLNEIVMPVAYTSFAITQPAGSYKVKIENSGKAENNNVWLMSEHTANAKATVLAHDASLNQLTNYIGLYPEVFTVSYFDEKGIELAGTAENVYANQSVTKLPIIQNEEGYNQSTWLYMNQSNENAFDESIKIDQDIKAYYTKEIKKFNITFVDFDNKELKQETVEYNKDAKEPKDLAREGYTFNGWDQAFDHIHSDLTIKANYTINNYQVNVKYIYANGLSAAPSQTIDNLNIINQKYDIESPTISGYTASKSNISGSIKGKDESFTVVYTGIVVNPIEDQDPILPLPNKPIITPTPTPIVTPAPIAKVEVLPEAINEETLPEQEIVEQETETVQPETTPLAKPDNNQFEKVEDEDTPLAIVESNNWALMNLISTAATILLGLGLLISKKNKEVENEDELNDEYQRSTWAKVIGIALSACAIIVFILTEDMSLPMVLVDKWTILMVAILFVQVIDFGLGKHWKTIDSDESETTKA
ncbi:MAG: InlB B-repeat-containing protein [Erysipelotrichaceae bacterium]